MIGLSRFLSSFSWPAPLIFFLFCAVAHASGAACLNLPKDFVYLRNVEPSIIQDMRYATERNFTGTVVDGYDAPECILRLEVARSLAKAQENLLKRGYSLKVFDCYRPDRAVKYFMKWVDDDEKSTKPEYYPNVKKRDLATKGYISPKSSHSLGLSVDLTVVKLRSDTSEPDAARGGNKTRARDGNARDRTRRTDKAAYHEIDMGTPFDFFGNESHTLNPDTPEPILRNRLILKVALEKQGFENYPNEWWHFNYMRLRPGERRYDFPIRSVKACRENG